MYNGDSALVALSVFLCILAVVPCQLPLMNLSDLYYFCSFYPSLYV